MQNTSRFAPDQLGAGADQALSSLARAGSDAAQLVEEWIKAGNAAAVQAAAELGSGPARKTARRGLNVLKSRGVQLPAEPRAGKLAGAAGAASSVSAGASRVREAWLLAPDPNGVVGIALAERLPSGSYQACFAYFREGREVLRVQSGQLSRSRLEKNMSDALANAGYGPVRVPWAWAQHRLVERRAWHAEHKVAEPLGWMGAEKLLADSPAEAPQHPFSEPRLQPPQEVVETLARDSSVLHGWPEFRSWLPGERSVQEMLLHIGQKFGPTPPTEQAVIDPIVKEQIRAATDRYFTPERRATLAHRMQDSGLSVLARLGEDAARQVSAVIQTIRGAGLITNPPSEIGFLTAFFEKALTVLAAQQGGRLRVPLPAAPPGAAAPEAPGAPEDPLGPAEAAASAEAPATPA
ncbi:MAG TPA: hypothetical protein VFS67_12545 [Polyangiaceae bacterium]|nr:hypothetical protein [Polyangiaceae bacterium]